MKITKQNAGTVYDLDFEIGDKVYFVFENYAYKPCKHGKIKASQENAKFNCEFNCYHCDSVRVSEYVVRSYNIEKVNFCGNEIKVNNAYFGFDVDGDKIIISHPNFFLDKQAAQNYADTLNSLLLK